MSSCNNNSGVTRIYVSQPCSPCNPCTSCNRCACDCSCNLPTYSTGGCISIQPSSCVKYDGTALPDQSITNVDTLTTVIEKLSAAISSGIPSTLVALGPTTAPLAFAEGGSKVDPLSESITHLKSSNTHLSSRVKALTKRVTALEKKPAAEFNFNEFLTGFVQFIQANPESASKFRQLFNFINDSNNFVLHPYTIGVSASGNSMKVTWSNTDNVSGYSVYYKPSYEDIYTKAGTTPNLGLTIMNLKPHTTYQVYVVSNGENGNVSAPSQIVTVQTI